ncbi:MAG: hypothetical protein ACTSXH_08925 [Promethearchaeota archaeon]
MRCIIISFPEFDDVGSFPLPIYIDKKTFNQFYWVAYEAVLKKSDIFNHRGIYNYYIHPLLQTFLLKINAGVEIVNFPQHMDMYTQFLKPIQDYEIEPNLIDPQKALITEMLIIKRFAKEFYERTNNMLRIKACITGPIELYVKKHGFTVYSDLALNFSKSVNAFLKNSLVNNKYMKTEIVSIDEPSLGYVDLFGISDDELIQIYDRSVEQLPTINQIHLHTLNRANLVLKSKNIDVLTCEYASDNGNEIPKRNLDVHDKYIRVGITRTNIDSIMAEALDSGVPFEQLKTFEGAMSLIDPKDSIRKNLLHALKHYGNRLKYVGPDCGLSGWPYPQVAHELLHRTFEVIQEVKKGHQEN